MVLSTQRFGLRRLPHTVVLSGILLALSGCGGGETETTTAEGAGGASAPGAAASEPGASNMMMSGAAEAPGGSGESGNAAAAGMPPGGMGMGPPGGMSMGPPGGMGMAPPGGMGMGPPGGMNPGGGAAMMPGGQGMPGSPGGGYGENGYPINNGAPAVSNRPAEFSAWSDEDFQNAVRERDSKVLEAISERVKSAPGNPSVADLLASLLVLSAEAPQSSVNGAAGAMNMPYAGQGMMQPGGSGSPGMPMGSAPPGGSGPAGMPMGSGGPGRRPAMAPVSAGSGPGSPGPPPSSGSLPPQSNFQRKSSDSLAVDSLSMMLAEAATAFQSAPAVGAIAGRISPGSIGAPQPPDSSAGGLGPAGAMPAGAMPAGGMSAGGMSAGGMSAGGMSAGGMSAGGMSAGGYPGGSGDYPGGAVGGGRLDDYQLVQQIVDGLIQNKTPKAWMTVHGIASGSVKTPLDLSTSAEIVVQGLFRNLVNNPTEIEQVIVALIDGKGGLPPESRSACLRAITGISGEAADLITGLKPIAAQTGQSGFGGESGMSGPGMMGPGMSAPGMSGPGMSAPGMMGPGMSGPGMAGPGMAGPGMAGPGMAAPGMSGPGMMGPGMSGPGMSGPGMGTFAPTATTTAAAVSGRDGPLPDAVLLSAAALLWSPRSVEALAAQLESCTDLNSATPLLLLAGTIPNKRIREAELATFARLHSEGADNLNNAGVFSSGAHDPGILVVLKSLPRQKPPRTQEGQAAPVDSWTSASQQMVLSLRDRLRLLSTQPGKLTPTGDSFPVRFHRGGTAEFSGMMTLPGPVGDILKESAPSEMRIYYARLPFAPQRTKEQEDVAGHYESKANGFRRVDQTKGVLWIDGVKGSQAGIKRSMDVVIQSSSSGGQGSGGGADMTAGGPGLGGPGPGRGAGGSFTIEIIVVETSDPKQGSEGAEQASTNP